MQNIRYKYLIDELSVVQYIGYDFTPKFSILTKMITANPLFSAWSLVVSTL